MALRTLSAELNLLQLQSTLHALSVNSRYCTETCILRAMSICQQTECRVTRKYTIFATIFSLSLSLSHHTLSVVSLNTYEVDTRSFKPHCSAFIYKYMPNLKLLNLFKVNMQYKLIGILFVDIVYSWICYFQSNNNSSYVYIWRAKK